MFLIIGFIVLICSANLFVDSASSLAKNLNVPKIIIGLTIVAFGTSVPEFAIACQSILSGGGEILLGNVIGSNIINILLILGICACINPLKVSENTYKKEMPMMILLTIASVIVFKDTLFNNANTDIISRSDGIVLVLFFGIFLWYLINTFKSSNKTKIDTKDSYGLALSLIYIVVGIFGIVVGSTFIVNATEKIATILNISERIISLTVVALGTSLPEIVTSVTAVKKKEHDLLLGNIIGSNIFNIGVVLGLPVALLGGVNPIGFTYLDLGIYLFSSILVFICCKKNNNITKKEGILFLILFILYYIISIF